MDEEGHHQKSDEKEDDVLEVIGRRSDTLRLDNEDLQANAEGGHGGDGSSHTARLPSAVITVPEHEMVAVGFNSGEVRMRPNGIHDDC